MTSQTSKTPPQTLEAIHQQNLVKFTQQLASARFWHVIPKPASKKEDDATSTEPPKPIALFDREAQLYYPPLAEFSAFLKKHPFLYLRKNGDNKNLATLHSETRLMWNNETSNSFYYITDGKEIVKEGQWAGLKGWQLPSVEQLKVFTGNNQNPYRLGREFRLKMANGSEQYGWLTTKGGCSSDQGSWETRADWNGSIFALNPLWKSRSEPEILLDLLMRDWCLAAPSGEIFKTDTYKADTRWQGL